MACFYGSVKIVETLLKIYRKDIEGNSLQMDNRGNSVLDMACIRGFSDDFGQEWQNPNKKESKDEYANKINVLKIKSPFKKVSVKNKRKI